jgi:hypothetical protein
LADQRPFASVAAVTVVSWPPVVRHVDPLAFQAAAAPVIARNEVEGVALEVSIAGFVRRPRRPTCCTISPRSA